MQSTYEQFKANIKSIRGLDAVYLELKKTSPLLELSDLLRAEWVYIVSAFDKLIHELIRIGMIQAFQDKRPRTKKFLVFNITLDTFLNTSNEEEKIQKFEEEINRRNRYLSFQHPDKIADGLSLIWDREHKWQEIAKILKTDENNLKTKLQLIVSRRNQIVHEADIDPGTGEKHIIEKEDIDSVIVFIEKLSETIFKLVQ